MTRKDLMRLRQLADEVKDSAAAVEELRSAAERTTTLLDGLPCACNTSTMRETLTIRLIAAEDKHRALTEQLFWRRTDAMSAIIEDVTDARCRQLLIARFIDCESWRAIGAKMHYCTRQLLRLCNQGLRELEAADAERGK